MNLDNVNSLTDAQSRTWTTLGDLDYSEGYASVQYFSNKLYVVGGGVIGNKFTSDQQIDRYNSFQVFDLASNGRKKASSYMYGFSSNFEYKIGETTGIMYAGSWIFNGYMTMFGGEDSSFCTQQSGDLRHITAGQSYHDSWMECDDDSVIEGTMISVMTDPVFGESVNKTSGYQVNYVNIFK